MILDFVPNHMALNYHWLETHPERFVQGDPDKLASEHANYFPVEVDGKQRIFAHGRDPYFEDWPDTIQLDYRTDVACKTGGPCSPGPPANNPAFVEPYFSNVTATVIPQRTRGSTTSFSAITAR
jgi:hypothetical protein